MPVIAQDLIRGKPDPVTIQLDQPAQRAIELMAENDFSQLPVVNPTNKPVGLITADSILLGVANLNLAPNRLMVAQVVDTVDRYYPVDYPIFEVLGGLNNASAVLLIHPDGKLAGIVTNWDAADYFRQRATDIMLLEDVEDLLKEHIEAAFVNKYGNRAEKMLQAAIDEVTNTSAQRAKDIKGALKKYANFAELKHSPREDLIETAFSEVIGKSGDAKSLVDLTFNEFITLLLDKEPWTTYSAHLTIPKENLKLLLDEVRKSRNIVAHFKREITKWERQRIEYCVKILQNVYSPLPSNVEIGSTEADIETVPFDDDLATSDSMYAPLARHLRNLPKKTDRIQTSFSEIEGILKTKLPDSARSHRSWWANDSVGHVQSQQWLAAGWRVASINMSEETITFSRNKDREKAYIAFFSTLLKELREQAPFQIYDVSPSGSHWVTAKSLSQDGRQLARLNLSFARQKQFRVELYIDTGDGDRNLRIFEHLYRQNDEIEAAFGYPLRWEPLDNRRACRISSYHDGAITDSAEKLAELSKWAVDATIRLEQAIAAKVEQAFESVQ